MPKPLKRWELKNRKVLRSLRQLAGETVMETITTDIPEHAGEPAYEFQPTIDGHDMFIKVTICERDSDHELLLLISAHKQQGGRRQ